MQEPSEEAGMSKIAVITGGAGGIGLSLAAKLAHRGYELVLVDIDESRLAQAAEQLGPGTRALQADLTAAAGLSRVADLLESDARIELLVNGAGIILPGAVIDMPYEELQ